MNRRQIVEGAYDLVNKFYRDNADKDYSRMKPEEIRKQIDRTYNYPPSDSDIENRRYMIKTAETIIAKIKNGGQLLND